MKKKLVVFIEDERRFWSGNLNTVLAEVREDLLEKGKLDELSILCGNYDFIKNQLPQLKIVEDGFAITLMRPTSYNDEKKRGHLSFLGSLLTHKFDPKTFKEGVTQFNASIDTFLNIWKEYILE